MKRPFNFKMFEINLAKNQKGITKVAINPWNSEIVAISTWESTVELYSTTNGQNIQIFHFEAPQMDLTWVNKSTIASVGSDGHVNLNGQMIGSHKAPASSILYLSSLNVIASGSYDGTLKLWTIFPSSLQATINLPLKILSMTSLHSIIYCACQEKDIFSINPTTHKFNHLPPHVRYHIKQIISNEKSDSLIVSTYSGRIVVLYPEEGDNRETIVFKAHEKKESNSTTVYPVNATVINPITGELVSGGSEGMIYVFNIETKRKIKNISNHPCQTGISSLSYSSDASKLAIAVSYGWEMGNIPHAQPQLFILSS